MDKARPGSALPLDGVRVIETATGVAGPYAAKLLGDLGATVTKLEPPGGDWTRRHGPFPEGRTDPERSALFIHLNAAKVLRSPDLDREPGSEGTFRSRRPGRRRRLVVVDATVDANRLRVEHPGLVVACFTPFGLTGPYAGYRADDITLYALGGPMIQTGVREREPLKLAGNQIQYQWGAVGAVATLGAVLRAEATGEGALLDIAGLETQVGSIDRQINHLLWRQWTGREVTRASRGASALLPSGYFPCLDGYVATVFIASWLPRLLDLLDDPELRQRCASPALGNRPRPARPAGGGGVQLAGGSHPRPGHGRRCPVSAALRPVQRPRRPARRSPFRGSRLLRRPRR